MSVMGNDSIIPAALATRQTRGDVLKTKTATARVKNQPMTPAVSAAFFRNAMRKKITITGDTARRTASHDIGAGPPGR